MDSEKITTSEQMTIDEAKRRLRLSGDKAKEFESKIITKQDGQFTDIMAVVFGWKLQKDGSKKLVSKMPSGKILFPDKSENLTEVEPGVPYICIVYDRKTNEKGEPGKEAFAKIICEEYTPKIFVPSSKIPCMVWVEPNGKMRNKVPHGNSYAERMMMLLTEAEKNGWQSIKIVFRGNQGV